MALFRAVPDAAGPAGAPQQPSPGFALALASVDERVRILEVAGGRGISKRLDAMGLRPGSEFTVLQREGPGGMLIQLGSSRLALGVGMLHRIRVCRV